MLVVQVLEFDCYNNSIAVNVTAMKKMTLNVFQNLTFRSCRWLSGFKNKPSLL